MNVIEFLGEREITKPTRINLFSLEYISTSAYTTQKRDILLKI